MKFSDTEDNLVRPYLQEIKKGPEEEGAQPMKYLVSQHKDQSLILRSSVKRPDIGACVDNLSMSYLICKP